MITWILLFSLVSESTQNGDGRNNGVLLCEPQNMSLATHDKELLLTWNDDPACLGVQDVLTYELVVLIEEEQVHNDTVDVTPDQIGSTHSWKWMPDMPLKYVSYSVRLRSQYKHHISSWKQGQTPPGTNIPKPIMVFPQDRRFKFGSRVTFYCILSGDLIFNKMGLSQNSGTDMRTTKINNQTYALRVTLSKPTIRSCTDVKCYGSSANGQEQEDNGACAYIGYSPGDKDLQCETRDMQTVECKWTVGSYAHYKFPVTYQLLGRNCTHGSKGNCSQKVQVSGGERNWTLTATNILGRVELTDRADLTKRVHMYAPNEVTASVVNARNVTLKWGWTVQQYSNLNIMCQVTVSNGEKNTSSEHVGISLNSAVLDDLIPDWTYTAKVRCGTSHFWKWSEWSSSIRFHTKGDVPDALDVWMQMMNNQTIITWKTLQKNQSHGHILDYEVTWTQTNNPERKTTTENSLALSLDNTEQYIIGVTARNINGSSSRSTITIPSVDSANSVDTSGISGSDGGFNLSWSADNKASCGYIVDWCPVSGECKVEWVRVPHSETNVFIMSENFKDGQRYLLSVYACTQGAPVLLERKEGYVKEIKIQNDLFKSLKWRQEGSDGYISWDHISVREQTASIEGYVLYCFDSHNNVVASFRTVDPEATSLEAKNLNYSSYTFTVKAKTGVGECGDTSITATLNSQTDYLIQALLLVFVIFFALLSLIMILCYRHWTCIKQKVYPPIPKPVLTDKRLTSPDAHRTLPVDLYHHSEVRVMDVPELHYKSDAPLKGYVTHAFTQTPKGYYNQPLKKNISLGFPSSPFKSVHLNPSYSMIIQSEDQQPNSRPDVHEGTTSERCFSGYQPQGLVNQLQVDPEYHLPCVTTYIALPQSS